MSHAIMRSIAVSLLFISTAVAADEAGNPVVVTATRTAQLADESLAPVIVIDREQIEQSQSVDIADLLRNYAGLDIARNGGPGQTTSLFMRGTNSDHVLVMMDGVEINPGTIGGPDLQDIDPDLIERVEIVKGPRSTLYGSEAIGGVINIITRRAAAPGFSDNAYVGTGPYDKAGAGAHQNGGDYRAGVDIGYTGSTGFPARTGSTVDNGYRNLSVNLYGDKRLGKVDTELSLWQAGGTSDYMDYFLNPVSQDYTNRIISLRLNTAIKDNWTTKLQLSQATDVIDQNQSSDYAHTRRNALDWQHNLQINPAQLLTAGLYVASEHASSMVFGSGFDQNLGTRAIYAQDDLTLGAQHLLFAARLTDSDAFGHHATWDAEYGYRFTPRTRITASVATAFRAPDFTDLYGYGGNPNLKPEVSRNIEVGLHQQLGARQSVAVSAFDNAIRDLIEYDLSTNQEMNIDRARIRGIEANYEYRARSFGARVDAISQNPEDRVTGQGLLRRARNSLTTSLFYDTGRYHVGADWLLTSKRPDASVVDGSNIYDGGYGLLNLTARMQLDREWAVQGRMENLTNQPYTLANGYNTARRSVYLEIRYDRKG